MSKTGADARCRRALRICAKIYFFAILLAAARLAQAGVYVVNVGGNQPPTFSPQTLDIHVGDTVIFVNKGGFHNALSDDNGKTFRCARGCDGQPGGNGAPSSSNWTAHITFNQAGSVGYYCEIHGAPGQGMYGTINVQAPAPPPPPPPPAAVPNNDWRWLSLLAGVLGSVAAGFLIRRARGISP